LRLLVLSDASSLHTKRWTEWFSNRGHQVLLASLEKPNEITVPFRKLPGDSGWQSYLAAARPLRGIIKEFRPHLINAHYVPSYGLLARLVGFRPLAVSAWGSDLLVSPQKSPLHRLRVKLALAGADLATCDGDNLKRRIMGFGLSNDRVINLPLGVEHSLILKKAPHVFRGGNIISTRSLEPVYNVDTIIRAISAAVKKTGRTLSLTIAGDGRLRDSLRDLSQRLGAEGYIRFTGRLRPDQLIAELDRCGIYVSASLSDSTSVSLLEAMARGLVPVVSDIPGNREWIEDGINGYLFPPRDHGALADIIAKLSGATECKEMVERNLSLISHRGSWQKNMEVIEGFFLKSIS